MRYIAKVGVVMSIMVILISINWNEIYS